MEVSVAACHDRLICHMISAASYVTCCVPPPIHCCVTCCVPPWRHVMCNDHLICHISFAILCATSYVTYDVTYDVMWHHHLMSTSYVTSHVPSYETFHVPPPIHMCHVTALINVTWRWYCAIWRDKGGRMYSYVWLDGFMQVRNVFVCVTCCIHTGDMMHSYVWYAAFMQVVWCIDTCDMPRARMWHAASIHVMRCIHMCDILRSYYALH